MTAPARPPPIADRGFALVLVLWLGLALGLLAATLGALTRASAERARAEESLAAVWAAAEAGLNRAAWDLMTRPARGADSRAGDRFAADALPNRMALGRAEVAVTIVPAAGLIDLNVADRPVLEALSRALTPTEDARPTALADLIVDWRDADGNRSLNGAEERDYRVAGLPYGPADRPFASTGEAEQLLGLKREQIVGLGRAATVYAGTTAPDLAVAPVDVLRLVPGITEGIIAEIVEARLARRGQSGEPAPAPRPVAGWDVVAGELRPRGPVYHVRSAARIGDGPAAGIEAMIYVPLPESRNVRPFHVLERRTLRAGDPELAAWQVAE